MFFFISSLTREVFFRFNLLHFASSLCVKRHKPLENFNMLYL